ncbi:hypothetical protein VTK26DRAFT_1983 [Humicola hyalothermophila]
MTSPTAPTNCHSDASGESEPSPRAPNPGRPSHARSRKRHNLIERKYRRRLNLQYKSLLDILPDKPLADQRPGHAPNAANNPGTGSEQRRARVSKAEVLDRARRYIEALEREHRRLVAERRELDRLWERRKEREKGWRGLAQTRAQPWPRVACRPVDHRASGLGVNYVQRKCTAPLFSLPFSI